MLVDVIAGAPGAIVSNVNVLLPVALGLPDASVATAVTVIVPSRRVDPLLPISSAAKTTATGVVPLPVTVFVTVCPDPSVKVTATLEPASAVTFTAPLALSTVTALSGVEVAGAIAGA